MPAVAQNSTSPRTRRSHADSRAAIPDYSDCLELLSWRVRDQGVVKLSEDDCPACSASASWSVASLPTSHEMGVAVEQSKCPYCRPSGSYHMAGILSWESLC